MADYIDIYDIQAKMQNVTFTASSNPTVLQVQSMIAEAEAMADARFNAVGIVIPITDGSKVNVITPIIINAVVAEVYRSIGAEPELAADRQALYESAMKNIEKHPAILREESITYTAPEGSTRRDPSFQRDRQDW